MVECEFRALRVGDALRHDTVAGLYTVVSKDAKIVSVRTGARKEEKRVHDGNYEGWQVYMKSELA